VDYGIAGKVRPGVAFSAPLSDEDYALVATIPHTTSEHPSQYAVRLQVLGLKEGAFNVQALGGMPLGKFMRKIGTLTAEQMTTLDEAVRRWLCLHA
jgi:mRNA-degrading endonuclease toxin of MazEF toxin-antitoxin module